MAVIVHISLNHAFNDSRIYSKEICSIKEKYEVWYFTTDNRIEQDSKVKTRLLKKRKTLIGLVLSLIEIKRTLKKIGQVDIVHIHDPILLLLSFVKNKNWKLVYDKHEYYEGYYKWHIRFNWLLRLGVSKLYSLLEFVALKNVDAIVQVSNQMPKTRFPEKEIVIPNYPFRKELTLIPFENRKNDLVFLGSINRYRGLHKIIEILPDLSEDTLFHIIGDFTDKDYESKLRALPGWRKVVYHGFLTHSEAEILMKVSKIGVMLFDDIPNHRFSLPTKYFEYVQFGLNILSNNKINLSLEKTITKLFEEKKQEEQPIEYFDSVVDILCKKYESLELNTK